ncbi:hypothetical protein WJX74_009375 [Apatococcus lobatus]|uniref:Uncharacterized protein n=1 Tax=Apatococcus lobatus TaxID=904363 RepID=A0AAW1Q8N9_9CHLO
MNVQVCSRCGHRKDVTDFPEQEGGSPPCCIACLVNGKAPSARKTRPLVMIPAVATKQCRRCQSVKPSDQFHCCRTHRDGLDTYCKICQAELSAERRTRQTRVVEITVTSKICRQCAEKKHVSAFNRNKNNPDGLASYCKPCRSQNEAGARSARRRRSQMASASASPSPSMRSPSPSKHGGSGNSSSPDVWPLQPEPGKMAMPPTPGSALRPLSAPLSRARTLGPPPEASATLPRIPGPGPWMPQSIVQLPRHLSSQLPGQLPQSPGEQAGSASDPAPAGSRPLSAYAESEGVNPDPPNQDSEWAERQQPHVHEEQQPRQARGRARRPPSRHADYSRDGSPDETPDRGTQQQRPSTQRGRSMQQAMRPLQPTPLAWGSHGPDTGQAMAQIDIPLGQAPSIDPPRRGLQPLGGRPVFGKSLRPFTAPAPGHLGMNGRSSDLALASSAPLSSELPSSAQQSPANRNPLGMPISATPQSAGPGLQVGSDNYQGKAGGPQLQLKGASVFPHANRQQAPPAWKQDAHESFPGSTANDLDAASALASISNSTSSFDPYPAGKPASFRNAAGLHKPVGDLTIVGCPVKRQRIDAFPSVSRAVDWRPSPPKASNDQPPAQTPLPFAPSQVRDGEGSQPVHDNPQPAASTEMPTGSAPGDSAGVKPHADSQLGTHHKGLASEPPQAATHRLGHCASSSFRFWASHAAQPQPAHIPQPATSQLTQASLPGNPLLHAESLVGLSDSAVQPGNAGHAMSHHPAGPLHSSKGGADAPTKGMANDHAEPEHEAAADLNDSDASETSHSEPGLEPWSRPAAGQAGPQPFATQRPSKRQRSSSLALHKAQPLTKDNNVDIPAAGQESTSDVSLGGNAPGVPDAAIPRAAGAEAEADLQLLQRAHDASVSTPDGQLNRLEAILTCLNKPHLLHQPHVDQHSLPIGSSEPSSTPASNPSSWVAVPTFAQTVTSFNPAAEVPPARGAPQAAAAALPAGASAAAEEAASRLSSMQMATEQAAIPISQAGLLHDPVPRPRRRSRPSAEVSAGDVSPKDTSLLAFFAAAAQQEGVEADLDGDFKEQAGHALGDVRQQLNGTATDATGTRSTPGGANDLMGAPSAKHPQPHIPWDKPQGMFPFSRKRRHAGLSQHGSLTRAHSEDVADWPFRWSGHRPRSGPVPRGMVF